MKTTMFRKAMLQGKKFHNKHSKKYLREKIYRLKKQKAIINKRVSSLERTNADYKKKIEELEQENRKCVPAASADMPSDSNGELKTAVAQYIPMMQAAFECDELAGLLEGFGIDKTKGIYHTVSLIRFVGLIGTGTTFTNVLYTYLEAEKIPLKKSMLELINRINAFYKIRYGVTFNVVEMPDMDSRIFNKAKMKDYDRRTSIFMYYDEVYTPVIMRNREDAERLALVHGHN